MGKAWSAKKIHRQISQIPKPELKEIRVGDQTLLEEALKLVEPKEGVVVAKPEQPKFDELKLKKHKRKVRYIIVELRCSILSSKPSKSHSMTLNDKSGIGGRLTLVPVHTDHDQGQH